MKFMIRREDALMQDLTPDAAVITTYWLIPAGCQRDRITRSCDQTKGFNPSASLQAGQSRQY
jgi:hypothetical protein